MNQAKKIVKDMIGQNWKRAKCTKCDRIMPKVKEGDADYCMDCEAEIDRERRGY